MLDRLAADGPFPELGDAMAVYGRLVGSWEIVSTWFRDGESVDEREGEWHFSWILGGRAVQDILYVKGAAPHEVGTTIRCYDAAFDAWRVVWMQPSGGEFVSLTGRPVGDTIVQEGASLDGTSLQRWTFSEITDESFLWRGESSPDGGLTWSLDQQMRAHRKR